MNEELKVLQHTWVEIWKIYMQWFTWHFGVQIGALAWAFTIAVPYVRQVSVFMALLGFLALLASIRMERFEDSVQKRANELNPGQQESPIFAAALTSYASSATIATNAFILVAWLYAAYALPSATTSVIHIDNIVHPNGNTGKNSN